MLCSALLCFHRISNSPGVLSCRRRRRRCFVIAAARDCSCGRPAVNPLPYFGQATVWPRGFPLHLISEVAPTAPIAWDAAHAGPASHHLRANRATVSVLVQQLLAQKVRMSAGAHTLPVAAECPDPPAAQVAVALVGAQCPPPLRLCLQYPPPLQYPPIVNPCSAAALILILILILILPWLTGTTCRMRTMTPFFASRGLRMWALSGLTRPGHPSQFRMESCLP